MESNAFTVLGLFLTLISLLGTFFYVHLSNWYRDMLSLRDKWDLNSRVNLEEEKQARRECRYEIRGLYNFVTLTVTLVISAFIFLVTILSALILIPELRVDPLAVHLCIALTAFVITYVTFTTFFLVQGYRIGRSLRQQIDAAFPKAAGND